ncbi:MAG: hypothetical protein R2852_07325 [Bacteroidia bacterium]
MYKNCLFSIVSLIVLVHCTKDANAQLRQLEGQEVKHTIHALLSPAVASHGNKQYFAEFNVLLSYLKPKGICVPGYFSGTRIGIESNLNMDNLILAPKLGYEMNAGVLCFRGNVISYFDNNTVDLRILPEVGITAFGVLSIMYGYSIPMLNQRSESIRRSRFTLSANIPLFQ